jgi:uroporphyrinogen-III synthase
MTDPADAPDSTGEDPPLAGRTIVITRSREQASSLSRQLRALGATVFEIPAIAILPPASYDPLDQALRDLATYDWLIVTSANTARVIGERRAVLSLSLKDGLPARPRTVAIGPATAAALDAIGLRVDLVPQPAVAESVVAALKDHVRGQRVLLARAEVARDILPVALEAAGARLTIIHAYRTALPGESAALVRKLFAAAQATQIDALTFTSSSTVKNLHTLLERAGVPWPAHAKIFSIGPITSGTLRDFDHQPDYEAVAHDVPGLVESLIAGLQERKRQPN